MSNYIFKKRKKPIYIVDELVIYVTLSSDNCQALLLWSQLTDLACEVFPRVAMDLYVNLTDMREHTLGINA